MNLDEAIKTSLANKLFLDEFLTKEEINNFYDKIEQYLTNRSSEVTFYKNLDDTISFLEKVGLDYRQITLTIYNWPAIIHSDKKDLLYKYLVLALPKAKGVLGPDRDDILINHPKDLMTGIDTIYARIGFFLSDNSDDVTRKDDITRRKLLKVTNKEFETSYGINREDLIKKYPFTKEVLTNILALEINKEVVERFYGNSKEFGKRSS